jgi:hypothetical protein
MADLVDRADQRNRGEAFASRESFGRHLFELITNGAAS